MDDADRAELTQQQYLKVALEARRRASGGLVGLAECQDCGQKIPARRRLAVPNCTRCINCQETAERGL